MSSSGGVLTLSPSADELDQASGQKNHLYLSDEESADVSEEEGHISAMKERRKQTLAKDVDGGSGVRFGSVRVHKHNLTLGDNPGAHTVSEEPHGTADSFNLVY
jgi:hypothetical protein